MGLVKNQYTVLQIKLQFNLCLKVHDVVVGYDYYVRRAKFGFCHVIRTHLFLFTLLREVLYVKTFLVLDFCSLNVEKSVKSFPMCLVWHIDF